MAHYHRNNGGRLVRARQPSLAGLMATRSTEDAFLRAEAAASRTRQRYGDLSTAEDIARAKLKARITLPTVKGYWE